MVYALHGVLRLCRKQIALRAYRHKYLRATNGTDIKNNNEIKVKQNSDQDKFQSLLINYKDKITFSSYLDHEKLELGYFQYYLKSIKAAKWKQKQNQINKSLPPLPVALKYIVDSDRLLEDEKQTEISETEHTFQLPFNNATKVQNIIDDKNAQNNEENIKQNSSKISDINSEFDTSNIDKWMTNYEYFDDTQLQTDEHSDGEGYGTEKWVKYYGTPDASASISQVPCGGCGALLHCNDPAIPGYLPSEIFIDREKDQLQKMECQRCHFLKEYNIALDVTVHPEEYENLLQSIRYVKSLVILMVDLLDFPCSIWPGIVDIIGTDRPLIIVGNKVDLLPGDSVGYLKRIMACLVTEINKTKLGEANVKRICLISAKTGYGVEDLISNIFKIWLGKGDVFLVGCTNVGKSSLFNALLQSDYCKVHAIDIIKRATVSRWPGTTLNLLKFPINRPSGWKIYQRTRRLKSEAKLLKVEKEIRQAHLKGKTPMEAPSLIGHIGRTFSDPQDFKDFTFDQSRKMTLDEKNVIYAQSKWFYDTPGVIHPDQVLSLLTTEELLLTIPKKTIRPQTYYLQMGATLFIGGLARLDLIYSTHPCRFTIFCSEYLPITVTKTKDADELYQKFLGTELFAAPAGGSQRLSKWPGLKRKEELIEFTGEGPKYCCGDVVLSSVAWVAVTAKGDSPCRVAAWTPEARGVHRRYPSLLPYSIRLKGKRLRDTPAYMVSKVFSEEMNDRNG